MSTDNMIQPRPVSVVLAALLGLILPGMGHVYLGQRAKGITIFAVSVATCGGLGVANIYCVLDGLLLAQTLRRGHAIGRWEGCGLLVPLLRWWTDSD